LLKPLSNFSQDELVGSPGSHEKITVWMYDKEYESVTQMIGSMSQQHCAEPAAFKRAN